MALAFVMYVVHMVDHSRVAKQPPKGCCLASAPFSARMGGREHRPAGAAFGDFAAYRRYVIL